jgi:hypothetical protein
MSNGNRPACAIRVREEVSPDIHRTRRVPWYTILIDGFCVACTLLVRVRTAFACSVTKQTNGKARPVMVKAPELPTLARPKRRAEGASETNPPPEEPLEISHVPR